MCCRIGQLLYKTVGVEPWGVLVFLKFGHFSFKLKETGSLGATEIGNFNVKT